MTAAHDSVQSPLIQTKSLTPSRIGWIICSLGAAFYCYEYLLRIAPAAMMPELRAAFHLDATAFGSLISLYYLAYTPMQAVVGLAHDLYRPRRVLIFAVGACILGSLLFGLASSPATAAVGRVLLGLGSAFAFVGAMKLASLWLPSNRFALFAGAITALGMMGGMFGNVFMSSFVAHVGWSQTYYVGAIAGLVLMALIWFIVRDTPPSRGAQRAPATIGYKETFQGLYLIAKNPQLWVTGAVASMLYLSLAAFAELWGNAFVGNVYGFSPIDAAKINSMVFVGWLVGAPLMGLLSDKLKRRRSPLILSSAMALIISVLMLVWHQPSFASASLLLFLFGLFTSAEVICFALGRENAPPEIAGTAVAFINLVVMAGGLIAQPLVGKLLDHYWSGGLMANGGRLYSAPNYEIAMMVLPIGCALALVFSFLVRETKAEMIGKSIAKPT